MVALKRFLGPNQMNQSVSFHLQRAKLQSKVIKGNEEIDIDMKL